MEIKVLGSGCARCESLHKLVRKAVEELKLDARVDKVEDLQEILGYGVMRTPALVIDEQVVMSGEIPRVNDLKALLLEIAGLPE